MKASATGNAGRPAGGATAAALWDGLVRRAIARALALLLGAVATFAVAGSEARAVTLFGTAEDIRPLQDVGLTAPDGAALLLAYKVSTVYFIGGIAVNNDGYVLVMKSFPDRFLDMPEGDVLRNFQTRGLLPNPLPPYSLGLFDYVRGYSLWIVLVLAAAGTGAFIVWGRRRPRF